MDYIVLYVDDIFVHIICKLDNIHIYVSYNIIKYLVINNSPTLKIEILQNISLKR